MSVQLESRPVTPIPLSYDGRPEGYYRSEEYFLELSRRSKLLKPPKESPSFFNLADFIGNTTLFGTVTCLIESNLFNHSQPVDPVTCTLGMGIFFLGLNISSKIRNQ